MANYYLEKKYISRGRGDSACAAAAYRSGERIEDSYYGETQDYTSKYGVAYSNIILPEDAPKELKARGMLWSVAEASEPSRDARLAHELEMSLPIELSLDENINLVNEYASDYVDKYNIGADVNIHDKGNGNPHAHVMLTSRTIDSDGFGEKCNHLNTRTFLLSARENWAKTQNRVLEEKGIPKVSHKSYSAQGIDKEPTKRVSKKECELAEKGIKTERVIKNEEINKRNAEKKKQEDN